MNVHQKLIHAVTTWDRKQAAKKGWHNPNALAIYLGRVEQVAAQIESGADPVAAITGGFNDRLRDHLLKAIAP